MIGGGRTPLGVRNAGVAVGKKKVHFLFSRYDRGMDFASAKSRFPSTRTNKIASRSRGDILLLVEGKGPEGFVRRRRREKRKLVFFSETTPDDVAFA